MKIDPYQKKSLFLFGTLSLLITVVDAIFIIFSPAILQKLLPINLFFIVFALFLSCTRFAGFELRSEHSQVKQLSVLKWMLGVLFIESIGGLFFLNILQASQLFLNTEILILNVKIPTLHFVLNLAFIKWGLFPFSLIAILAAGLAYVYYYRQESATISNLLPNVRKTYYEVFIKRVVNGSLGAISNFAFIISISIGILTTGRLILSLVHMNDSVQLRIGGVIFFIIVTLLSVFKIIPWLAIHFSKLFKSEALAILFYMLLALLLFLFCYFFAFKILDFAGNYISLPDFKHLNIHSALQVRWPLIIWAWWICWAPLLATAVARISYGYSMRAIILATLFFPAIVSLLLSMNVTIPGLASIAHVIFNCYELAVIGPLLLIIILMRVNGGKLLVFGFMPKDGEGIATKTIKPINFVRSTLQVTVAFMAVFLIRNIYGIQFLMLLAAIPNTVFFIIMSLLFYKKIFTDHR